jgi:hypothetical protein
VPPRSITARRPTRLRYWSTGRLRRSTASTPPETSRRIRRWSPRCAGGSRSGVGARSRSPWLRVARCRADAASARERPSSTPAKERHATNARSTASMQRTIWGGRHHAVCVCAPLSSSTRPTRTQLPGSYELVPGRLRPRQRRRSPHGSAPRDAELAAGVEARPFLEGRRDPLPPGAGPRRRSRGSGGTPRRSPRSRGPRPPLQARGRRRRAQSSAACSLRGRLRERLQRPTHRHFAPIRHVLRLAFCEPAMRGGMNRRYGARACATVPSWPASGTFTGTRNTTGPTCLQADWVAPHTGAGSWP